MNMNEIYWLAGLLEGEGCFLLIKRKTRRDEFRIQLFTVDRDVAEHAKVLLQGNIQGYQPKSPNKQFIYKVAVDSRRAIGWMMTLYSLMHDRRKARIRELILMWRAQINKNAPKTTPMERMMAQNNMTKEQILKIIEDAKHQKERVN